MFTRSMCVCVCMCVVCVYELCQFIFACLCFVCDRMTTWSRGIVFPFNAIDVWLTLIDTLIALSSFHSRVHLFCAIEFNHTKRENDKHRTFFIWTNQNWWRKRQEIDDEKRHRRETESTCTRLIIISLVYFFVWQEWKWISFDWLYFVVVAYSCFLTRFFLSRC